MRLGGSSSLVVWSSLGVILAAAYMLWMVQRVFYGEVTNPKNEKLRDLSPREAAVLLPLVALALFMGVASPLFTRSIEPSVDALVRSVRSHVERSMDAQAPAVPAARVAEGAAR